MVFGKLHSLQMALCQIYHMNIIPQTGTIWCIIVITKNRQLLPLVRKPLPPLARMQPLHLLKRQLQQLQRLLHSLLIKKDVKRYGIYLVVSNKFRTFALAFEK